MDHDLGPLPRETEQQRRMEEARKLLLNFICDKLHPLHLTPSETAAVLAELVRSQIGHVLKYYSPTKNKP